MSAWPSRPVKTAMSSDMSSETTSRSWSRYRGPDIYGEWTLMYIAWEYHLNPDLICVNCDDEISYNGGPFHGNATYIEGPPDGSPSIALTFSSYYPTNPMARYVFTEIQGTKNWLHRSPERPQYTCILMPLSQHLTEPSDSSSGEEFVHGADPRT